MKRPLLTLFVGFVLGEAASMAVGGKGLFAVLFAAVLYRRIGREGRGVVLFAAACLFGCLFALKETYVSSFEAALAEEERSGSLRGTVAEERENSDGSLTLVLEDAVFYEDGGEQTRLRGKCQVYYAHNADAGENAGEETGDGISIRSRVSCEGSLCALEEERNPGEYPSRIYALSRGIRSEFEADACEVLSGGGGLRYIAACLRGRIEAVYRRVMGEEEAGLLDAMVLGDKAELDPESKELYRENGVAHVLAVSGMHVSILGGSLYRLLRRRGAGYLPACLCGSALIFFYGCMTGFGSPVVRAAIMYAVYLGGQYFGADYDIVSALSLAGLLMLMEYPYRLLEGGFLISFAAVGSLALVMPVTERKREEKKAFREQNGIAGRWDGKKRLKRLFFAARAGLASSLCVTLATAPLVLYFYYELAPYGVLLNLLVIPLMSVIMLSAVLGGVMGLFTLSGAFWLCLPARVVLRFFDFLFRAAQTLPFASLVVGRPPLAAVAFLYLLETVLFFCYRGAPPRRERVRRAKKGRGRLPDALRRFSARLVSCGLPAGLAVCGVGLAVLLLWNDHSLRITMLDVGQGECILLRLPDGEAALIDGGSTSRENVGEKVIQPALKYYGIRRLAYVIVSHEDEDHISGIRELLAMDYPIGCLVLRKDTGDEKEEGEEDEEGLRALAEESGVPVADFSRGSVIEAGALRLTCVHPSADYPDDDANSASVVLHLQYGTFDALFSGDVDEAGEEAILAWWKSRKETATEGQTYQPPEGTLELYKAAHHGSKTANSEAMLAYLHPETAIISSGRNNRYGHPHAQTLARLAAEGADVYQTKLGGAIEVRSDGEEYTARYFRERWPGGGQK